MTDKNQPNLLQFFQRKGAGAAARTTASTNSSPAAIKPSSDNIDNVQELDIDGDGDIFVGGAVNGDNLTPQPELHTTPNANEGSQAVAGGVDVEVLNVGGEHENLESDAAEGLNVEVSVFIFE